MRLSWLSILAFAASSQAQYFSEGWKPGQGQPTQVAKGYGQEQKEAPKEKARSRPKRLSELLDLNAILTSEPVAALFQKAGINITERLSKARESPWDPRIPLITDDSYEEIIVNESLTEEEEKRRTWFLLVSGDLTQAGGISQFVDQIFDEAFNETMIANDLPDLRWGRIDYLNVTYLTTKWAVWQAPQFVFIKDRGQSLRFFRPQYLRIRDGGLREFLKQELYLHALPWDTAYSPGGSREYLMHYLALTLMKVYNITVLVPRWVLYILSGSVASFIIQIMHKPQPPKRPAPARPQQSAGEKPTPPKASDSTSQTTTTPSKAGSAKQRKGKK
ncbi:hypothetical protein Moror_16892 [Moniliophthora roreri MCA 2997]|uniref:Uncharacterized protein n=1 Tax=Moniliophthora roreri (strain MCA 2997) TaxID=1381753 RepID=V2YDE6_MONRO|nr:hypothetical protein Moror_16892 [Moniliophthora roreri MCA 2997]